MGVFFLSLPAALDAIVAVRSGWSGACGGRARGRNTRQDGRDAGEAEGREGCGEPRRVAWRVAEPANRASEE